MTTTDINSLADRARAATDAIIAAPPPGITSCGRTCADLASELSRAATVVPDAVAQAEAFIDIAVGGSLTEEMQDCAAFGSAALFLGRRLVDTNVAEIVALHPRLAGQLEPLSEMSSLLDELSCKLLRVFNATERAARHAT